MVTVFNAPADANPISLTRANAAIARLRKANREITKAMRAGEYKRRNALFADYYEAELALRKFCKRHRALNEYVRMNSVFSTEYTDEALAAKITALRSHA